MNSNILKKLNEFGLSETEARVYYATLALEKASVDKIAKHSNTNRSACYPVLERLKSLGVISQVKTKGKTMFKASTPEKFLELLEEKRQAIQGIIPDLKSLLEISEGKPDVRFYEGKEGLKTVLNSILKETNEVLILGDGDSFKKSIPGWSDYYSDKRLIKNIKVKMILRGTPLAIQSVKKLRSNKQKSKLVKIRLLPEAYRLINCGFDAYNNKVILYSFEKQKVAVVIESKVISQMMKTVFEILWNEAEKYGHLAG